MGTRFELFVTYSQIAVFDPALQNPFNGWRPLHVAQGFSWRPESVSFRTLKDSGIIQVEVQQANEIEILKHSVRAIRVPFTVKQSGLVEVSSIDRGNKVSIPEGNYALIFETGHNDDEFMWCRFTFTPKHPVEARILRADSSLSPRYPLLMEADPA